MTGTCLMQPTVHLVDDDAAIRKALRRIVAAEGFDVVCHSDAETFVAALDPMCPGCAVIDLRMPGIDGLMLQRRLGLLQIDLPVIFLSGQGDVASCAAAMKGGALDFLEKPVGASVLIAAIERALALDTRRREASEQRDRYDARVSRLTPREQEVMTLVVAGRMNKQIAADLGLAEKTVKVHRQRVMQKLEVRTVAELVSLVVGHAEPLHFRSE